MDMSIEYLREAAKYIESRITGKPQIGMILGSGLGALADKAANPEIIPYSDIPHFPVSTVAGHEGRLVCGEVAGRKAVIFQGRFHFYEGYSMEETVIPVRIMKLLGIEDFLVTNAAGGINKQFSPGNLMVIEDHIKFFDHSPLRGKNIDELGPRFNDLSNAYDPQLREMLFQAAEKLDIPLCRGVYAFMPGPSFETPAEIRMLRTLGADAVGMSTVPEVIAASHAGMRVLGISCITNMAAGILPQPLTHQEVMETGEQVKDTFQALIFELLALWDKA